MRAIYTIICFLIFHVYSEKAFAGFSNSVNASDVVIFPLRDALINRDIYFYKYNDSSDRTSYLNRSPGIDGTQTVYTGQTIYLDGNYFYEDTTIANNAFVIGFVENNALANYSYSGNDYYKCILYPNKEINPNESLMPSSLNINFTLLAPATPGDYYIFIYNRSKVLSAASISSLNTTCNNQLNSMANLMYNWSFSSYNNSYSFYLTNYNGTYSDKVLSLYSGGNFYSAIPIKVLPRTCNATYQGNVYWGTATAGTTLTLSSDHVTTPTAVYCSCGFRKGYAQNTCITDLAADPTGRTTAWSGYAGPSCFNSSGVIKNAGCTSDSSTDQACAQKCTAGNINGINYPEMWNGQSVVYHAGSWDSTYYNKLDDGTDFSPSISPCSGSWKILNKSVKVTCNYSCPSGTCSKYSGTDSYNCPTYWNTGSTAYLGAGNLTNHNTPYNTNVGSCDTPQHYKNPLNSSTSEYLVDNNNINSPFSLAPTDPALLTAGIELHPSGTRAAHPNWRAGQYGLFKAYYDAGNPTGRGFGNTPNPMDRILTLVDLSDSYGGVGNNIDLSNGNPNGYHTYPTSGNAYWREWHGGTVETYRMMGSGGGDFWWLSNQFSTGAVYEVIEKSSTNGNLENIFSANGNVTFTGFGVQNSSGSNYELQYLYLGSPLGESNNKNCLINFNSVGSQGSQNYNYIYFAGIRDTRIEKHMFDTTAIWGKNSNIKIGCYSGGCRYCKYYNQNSPISLSRSSSNIVSNSISLNKFYPQVFYSTTPSVNSNNPCNQNSGYYSNLNSKWNGIATSGDHKVYVGDDGISVRLYKAYVARFTSGRGDGSYWDSNSSYSNGDGTVGCSNNDCRASYDVEPTQNHWGDNWGFMSGSNTNTAVTACDGSSLITNNLFIERQRDLEENLFSDFLNAFDY